MKTQKEYMSRIKAAFNMFITQNKDKLKAYSYINNEALSCIKSFFDFVKADDTKFSNCYHANGIGNNNEYTIYVEDIDENGFLIKKEIAEFYYCTGIFGGVSAYLKDLATGEKIIVGRAR